MSRQKQWQRRQKELGNCTKCGHPLDPFSASYCTRHLFANRVINRFPTDLWSRALDQFLK